MLNLLLNPKSWLPIGAILIAFGAISYGWYWHSQYGKSQATNAQLNKQLAICTANQQLLESAVQRWKAAADQYEEQLKRKEALVAKQTAESNKRLQAILQKQYSPNCEQAIQQGIELIQPRAQLVSKFIWNNTIP